MTRRGALGWLATLLGLQAGCSDGGYQRQGGGWRYEETAFTPADPAGFQPLDERFARDGRQGYYRGSAIAGSHGPSFEVLGEHEARDRVAVYYADTFRKGQEYWAWRHIRIETLAGADPAQFHLLGQGWSADAQQVWFEGQPCRVRHRASFEVLSDGHARDRERGYYEGQELAASRGTQLRSLGRGYASDGRRVWFRGQHLSEADAASFEVPEPAVEGRDAQDRHGAWLYGRRAP